MKYCVKYKTAKIKNGTEFFADYDKAENYAYAIASKKGRAILLSVDENEVAIIRSY